MNRNTPLFPTSYLPPLPLMAAMVQNLVRSHDNEPTLLIEQCETYPKQTLRNRTVIMTAGGAMTLSVPVVKTEGPHTLTSDITISYAEKWNLIHWRAIKSAYNASPFFIYYEEELEELLMRHYERLIELNESLLYFLLHHLKTEGKIIYTDDFEKPCDSGWDFRNRYNYKHPENNPDCPYYTQVFSDRMPFNSNVSILDLLFNMGPEAKEYLLGIAL